MNIRLFVSVASAGAALCGSAAVDLGGAGDFSDARSDLAPMCMANGGRVSLVTEDATWNKCGKLEVVNAYTNADGYVTHSACAWIGLSRDRKRGFDVKPNTQYRFSIELRHPAARVSLGIGEWHGDDMWKDLRSGKCSTGLVCPKENWSVFKGTFKTGPDAKRAVVSVVIWTSTQYNTEQAKVGDYVLFDNVTVEEQPDVIASIRARGRTFAVAPVPVVSDYAVPFRPLELLAPPTNIALRAAGNEIKCLPLALANATARMATYRVIVESVPVRRPLSSGRRGLEGFPSENVTFRKALTFRDADEGDEFLRLDPLPEMDTACTVDVPPGEAGLAWFDFDTTGVKPGTYRGRVRVIPLGEKAEWTSTLGFYDGVRYTGGMLDVPLSLEVMPFELPKDPKIPLGCFQSAETESAFRLMMAAGIREIAIGASFKFPLGADGKLDLDGRTPSLDQADERIGRQLAWARKYGVRLRWFIGFNTFEVFRGIYGLKGEDLSSERLWDLWAQWTKGVERYLTKKGIPLEDCLFETLDEAGPDKEQLILKIHRIARAAAPGLKLCLTLAANLHSMPQTERYAEVTDAFVLCHHGYFTGEDRLGFVARQLAAGKFVSHYTCSESMRASLNGEFRGNAWFGERYGLTGNHLFWFADAYYVPGETDFKVTTRGGIAYRSFDEYMPSLRYMALREGMTDVRYLQKLGEMAGDGPKAKEFLRKASQTVVEALSNDPCVADRQRERIADLCLKVLKRKD